MATTKKGREKEALDFMLETVLEGLQEDYKEESDRNTRVYGSMGCIRSLLRSLRTSSRLTKTQREQLALIEDAWFFAVFGKNVSDVLGSAAGPRACPTDEKEEV